MQYRRLGRTGLMVSEIGLGAEWLERHNEEECVEIIRACEAEGINILDCWMSEPNVRTNIGKGIAGHREKWYIQGHIGSTWQNGQYHRTRELSKVKEAFEDQLTRLGTDYVDLGMIHFVDTVKEFYEIIHGEFYKYVLELKKEGKIHHIGLSTHNPEIGVLAVEEDVVDMLLFSINPAYDMIPATEAQEEYLKGNFEYTLGGIDPVRVKLYNLCEEKDIGITVMKGYAGGRLFDAKRSPFGVAMTPVQCIHYALTRPAVASILTGFDCLEHIKDAVAYETATEEEKDYAAVLAKAPKNPYTKQCTYCGHCKPCPVNLDIAMINKYYDLAEMQKALPSSLLEHYKALDAHASDCIGCGLCESRCPFGVEIVKRMELAAAKFGL